MAFIMDQYQKSTIGHMRWKTYYLNKPQVKDGADFCAQKSNNSEDACAYE